MMVIIGSCNGAYKVMVSARMYVIVCACGSNKCRLKALNRKVVAYNAWVHSSLHVNAA